MKESKEKQILKAIIKNYSLSDISKVSGVPQRTLNWRVNNKQEYKDAKIKAKKIYMESLWNIFES